MSAPPGTGVRFERVYKSFNGVDFVVEDLNVIVEDGEFLTLLGPSGSGKSTCLMMLAGFEAATHGEIYLNDKPINRMPPHKRGIGVVFQNYALFSHMTVNENLAFPLRVRGVPRGEQADKVRRALSMVELDGLGHRYPGQLSGGQQQRVALARALVFEPRLVLMDEPLGALDKQLREQMQYEIKHIHERLSVTMVYVTHDQTEALTMSDRIAVLNEGKIQQICTPDSLYEAPQNSFVAQFIGENNRLHGKVVDMQGNDRCLVEVGQGLKVEAAPVQGVGVGVGDTTTLSIRPERVEIQTDTIEGANAFPATVEELVYIGDHLRVRLDLAGVTNQFIVKVRNRYGRGNLRPGAPVYLGWKPQDCLALDHYE